MSTAVTLSNGMIMPAIGYGTWKLSPVDAANTVYNAIKIGYRQIDCAHIYGNETEVGQGINRAISEGIVKREDLWVTSKLWNDDHLAEDIVKACDLTLSRLNVGYLDLYLIHWPTNWIKGSRPLAVHKDLSLVEIYNNMEALVDAGKVKALGVSNFSTAEVQSVVEGAKKHKPVMNQVESHPYWNQLELQETIAPLGVGITAYSPLNQNGPDSLDPVQERHDLFTNDVVLSIAEKHSVTPAQVLLRFHIDLGRVVIPKSKTPSRIQENFDVLKFKLDDDEVKALLSLKPQIRGLNPYNFNGEVDQPFFKY